MVDHEEKYNCQARGENNMNPDDIFDERGRLVQLNAIVSGHGKDQAKTFRIDHGDFPKCFDGSLFDILETSVLQDTYKTLLTGQHRWHCFWFSELKPSLVSSASLYSHTLLKVRYAI